MMSAISRFVMTLGLCVMALVAISGEAKADSWVETYRTVCPTGSKTLNVTCTREGEEVILRFGCGGQIATYTYTCQHPKLATTSLLPKITEDNWFDYQLGLHTSGVFATGELPQMFYIGGEFSAQLKLSGKWWISGSLGLGYARVDGDNISLTESFGLQYRINTDWNLGLVARHYVVLDGEGDVLQVILPTVEIVYNVSKGLQVVLNGGAGWGHFRVSERISAESSVAPSEYTTITRDDLVGTLGLNLRAKF
ncbi:MAG: hypothetical protein WC025_00710 [Candidatus Magasanikbacteria bacterium]